MKEIPINSGADICVETNLNFLSDYKIVRGRSVVSFKWTTKVFSKEVFPNTENLWSSTFLSVFDLAIYSEIRVLGGGHYNMYVVEPHYCFKSHFPDGI